jgi:hypothetical protein
MAVKDSGKRQEFAGGMVRDVEEGKVDYSLVFDGPMFERWAAHLTEGAKKYDKRNWMKAEDSEAADRFRESAVRHFVQWLRGDVDEDHAAATFFNVNGVELMKTKKMVDKPIRWVDKNTGEVIERPKRLECTCGTCKGGPISCGPGGLSDEYLRAVRANWL